MYYMSEVVAGQGHGGLFVIPGSHKAAFRWPEGQPTSLKDMTPETRSLFTEIPGKPGTALIFTHNLVHASLNESDRCRRGIHTAYNFGLFSRGWLGDHTDYEALHEKAPSGSWLASFRPLVCPCFSDAGATPDLLCLGAGQEYLTRRPDYTDAHAGVERPPDIPRPRL